MVRRPKKNPVSFRGMEIEDYLLTATEKEAAKMEKSIDKKPLGFLWIIVVATFFILIGRVYYLNISKGSYYSEVSKDNRVRNIIINAPRGKIMDRSGGLLADNVPGMDAVVIRADIAEKKIKETSAILARILSIEENEIREKINSADPFSLKPILIKENISQDQTLAILEEGGNLSGVEIIKTAIRNYSEGLIFSHILGYVGKASQKELEENNDYLMTDYIGKQGIEKEYERELKGKHGFLQVEVDSQGRIKRELGIIDPVAGNDLLISVDGRLQKKIFDEIFHFLEKIKGRTAAAVAIDPRNGEVLALVSFPGYNNNDFVHGISSDAYKKIIEDSSHPLFNRAISGEYPPGSTIKPVIASAALSEKIINSATTIDCSGAIFVGNYRFGDWKIHGKTNVRKAIAESCDVFFYAIGGGYENIGGLGIDRMRKYFSLFGFGDVLGIDLPGEQPGFIPSEQWKMDKFEEKWYTGNNFHAAIGQGYITSTPLQLAVYTASIANKGVLYKPRIVSRINKKDGQFMEIKPQIIRKNFIDPKVIEIIQEGMRQTVVSGTAQSLGALPVEVAGKTGTSQFGRENKTHSWFVSYAPYKNPEIAMAVLLEGLEEGHSGAVPITKEIYAWYFGDR